MYILEEIDAALDLSYTQHINTLFRTRFHDGTSIFERTARRNNFSLYDHAECEREEHSAGQTTRCCVMSSHSDKSPGEPW
jgi:hypothetical protein